MDTIKEALLERFVSLKYLQLIPKGWRVDHFNALATKYTEKHRRYHTLDHIVFCFDIFERFQYLAKNPTAIATSIFYHDLFYDVGVPARENEERSALFLAQAMKEWGCQERDVYESVSAVLATTHDHTPSTNDNRLMVDIDLAGLGALWPIFLKNNLNVREEYKDIPEDKFREGNSKILQRFLDRDTLYYHPEVEATYGDQARENLTRWLNRP